MASKALRAIFLDSADSLNKRGNREAASYLLKAVRRSDRQQVERTGRKKGECVAMRGSTMGSKAEWIEAEAIADEIRANIQARAEGQGVCQGCGELAVRRNGSWCDCDECERRARLHETEYD